MGSGRPPKVDPEVTLGMAFSGLFMQPQELVRSQPETAQPCATEIAEQESGAVPLQVTTDRVGHYSRLIRLTAARLLSPGC